MNLWIQRPIGQLAGLLLLAAMVLSGVRTELHAHADADHGHGHSAQAAVDHSSDHDSNHDTDHGDVPASSDPTTTVLHVHDIGTTLPAFLDLPELAFSALSPMALGAPITALPALSTSRIPPHRPPIV